MAPDIMEGKLVPSQKGTSLLEEDNGFRYGTRHPMSAGQVHYKCVKKTLLKCPAYAAIYNPSKNDIVKKKRMSELFIEIFQKDDKYLGLDVFRPLRF